MLLNWKPEQPLQYPQLGYITLKECLCQKQWYIAGRNAWAIIDALHCNGSMAQAIKTIEEIKIRMLQQASYTFQGEKSSL
jgi:hypothetical protein